MLELIFIFTLVLIVSCNNIQDAVDEKIGLSAIELIKKNGYPSEVHTIHTKDGYLLEVYRIPYGRNNKTRNNSAPLLIYSGLFSDSSAYVCAGVNRGLGYILADLGYDVWLGNNRGTTNCKRHIKLDPHKDKKKFWNFSFQEMASYDLPATIDYILKKTNKENLHYIGHSQGTTSVFAMLAEKPLYNKKIRLVTALSPVVSSNNIGPPMISNIMKDFSYYTSLLKKYQFYEILPLTENYKKLVKSHCVRTSPLQDLCILMACTFFNFSYKEADKLFFPIVLSNLPAGASLQQLLHYMQLHQVYYITKGLRCNINPKSEVNWYEALADGKLSRKGLIYFSPVLYRIFRKFDYGKKKNLNKYDSEMPPVYNFSNIQVPIAIFYGENDILSTVKNVEILAAKLPNVVFKKLIKNFKHADMVLASDAYNYIFTDMFTLLEKF